MSSSSDGLQYSSSDSEEIERKISNVSIDDQRTLSKKSSFSSIVSEKSNKSIDLSDACSTDHSSQESVTEKTQDGRQYSRMSSISREKTRNSSIFENTSRENNSINKIEKKNSRGSTKEYISVDSNLSNVLKNSSNTEKFKSFVLDSSFDDKYSLDDFEKEDSMLAERDGKFEFIDTENLRIKRAYPNDNSSPCKLNLDNSKRAIKKSDYQHIQSKYAMPELQREMKKKRVSIIQMRKQEEKVRMQLEEKERQETAERSFKKWLEEKNECKKKCDEKKSINQPKKPSLKNPSFNKERSELAEQAFNEWLELKRAHQKREMEIEKLRLADEAQYCIIRDKAMCNKAFNKWLQTKVASNEKKQSNRKPSKHITSKLSVSMY